MGTRLNWNAVRQDPPLQFRGHIPSHGSLMVDIVDAFGATLEEWDETSGAFVAVGRFGRQVASTRTWLRCDMIPPHEQRRIKQLVKDTPSAVRAKAYISGVWVVVS